MHPDLSPHLHTPECNDAIRNLLTCHDENKVTKFFGVCNDVNEVLNRCLRKEREDNRKKSQEHGRALRDKGLGVQKQAQ